MDDHGTILAVDDTPASLRLLTDILTAHGYEVRSAISGQLALQFAFSNPPELILLDISMPEMDGYEVCRRLKARAETQNVPVIFISALTDTKEKVLGFQLGAVDFVTKPYQQDELLARVHTHMELNRLRNHLEELVVERTAALKISEGRLRSTLLESVAALAAIVEKRDPYTAGHQRRVSSLAVAIAKEMHLPAEQIEGLQLACVVHDVGQIQVPAEILSKPAKINNLEYRLVQQHPQAGYEILEAIEFPWPIAMIVSQHHERIDGSGYPRGIKGNEILLEAKILAVADTVEAMMSHRPYRPALGQEAALNEITANRGILYEPEVVDACISLFRIRGFNL